MSERLKVMFARFPGGGMDRAEVTDWLVRSVIAAKEDARINPCILNWRMTDTPITMSRNRCVADAQKSGVDVLVMVDNDMHPDFYLPDNPYAALKDPTSRPFFESSFDLLYHRRMASEGPAVIGAPYCGPPPHENVYVFQWQDRETNGPEDGSFFALEGFTREDSTKMSGITEVAALPTGLIMFDMRAFAFTDPPYFYYEWEDETESAKASTEDVTLTRDLSLNSVPQFCNWDAWAGHWKQKCVGRPVLLSPKTINRRFRSRILAELNIMSPNEELIFVGRNGKASNGHVTDYVQTSRIAGPAPKPEEVTICE